MADLMTLQRARDLMNRIVNLRINNPSLPTGNQRIYPVAALGPGNLLLSNGQIRTTPIMDILAKMAQGVLTGQPQDPMGYARNLAVNIAVPAKQTGKTPNQAILAFSNYLSSVLQPKIQNQGDMAIPATMLPPSFAQSQVAFSQPFELANLPRLAEIPQISQPTIFENIARMYANKLAEWQNQAQKPFGATGESVIGNLNRFANLPLVQGYGTGYRLPTASNAPYAQISTNPFIMTNVI